MPLFPVTSIGSGTRLDYTGETATILADVVIASTNGYGIDADGASNLVIEGQVHGATAVGITGGTLLAGDGSVMRGTSIGLALFGTNPYVSLGGELSGDYAIYGSAGDARVVNSGTITGWSKAMWLTGDGTVVVNAGVMRAVGGTVNYAVDLSSASDEDGVRFVNRGLVESLGLAFRGDPDGTETLRNFGTLAGEVFSDGGDDLERNAGFIDGMVRLGDGDDIFRGKGGAVEDGVFGGFGDDVLRGGAGDDLLNGGDGQDRLRGGRGEDLLIGGADADRFVIDRRADWIEIADYAAGEDRIDLSAFGLSKGAFRKKLLDKALSGSGKDALLDLGAWGGEGFLELDGVAADELGNRDFLLG